MESLNVWQYSNSLSMKATSLDCSRSPFVKQFFEVVEVKLFYFPGPFLVALYHFFFDTVLTFDDDEKVFFDFMHTQWQHKNNFLTTYYLLQHSSM